jgi:S-methylmethionine-dependent homocysteine/selenocysteine methylase
MSFVVPDDGVLVADGGLATELAVIATSASYQASSEGFARRALGRQDAAGQSRHSAGQLGQWMAAGARTVGGCCRVRPADIAVIAQAAAEIGRERA